MTISTDTWLEMVDQARAAGTQIIRRREGVFVRIGPTRSLVEVGSLDELEDLIAANADTPIRA